MNYRANGSNYKVIKPPLTLLVHGKKADRFRWAVFHQSEVMVVKTR